MKGIGAMTVSSLTYHLGSSRSKKVTSNPIGNKYIKYHQYNGDQRFCFNRKKSSATHLGCELKIAENVMNENFLI